MTEGPRASVLIPTHQRRESLRRALLSLAEQSTDASSYEVVVYLDGCTDGSQEMLAGLSLPYNLRSRSGPGEGRATACNGALELARGEILIILDDDMSADPELVARHCAHHPPGSRQCVVGAAPILLDGKSPHAARYARDKFDAHLHELARPDHRFGTRDFYSGNASLRTAVLREVDGFDESFAVYGNEDLDLALRLRKAGVTLRYEPSALAWQSYEKSLGGLQRDTLAKGRTTVQLLRRHPEVFPELRLAHPYDGSRPWLAARAIMLSLARLAPAVINLFFALFSLAERLGLWRVPLFYRPVVDYAFWAGVDLELRESGDDLSNLAKEVRRGPIDLLLHR